MRPVVRPKMGYWLFPPPLAAVHLPPVGHEVDLAQDVLDLLDGGFCGGRYIHHFCLCPVIKALVEVFRLTRLLQK